jgi:hypothetical protein
MKILFLFFGLAVLVFQTDRIIVKGKVIDGEGNGLPGASVIESGTTNGTTTDLEGNFLITVKRDAKISFSFVGYSLSSIDLKEKDIKGLKTIENLTINLEAGSLLFCCTNHSESHCANTLNKMSKLATEKSCTF